MRRHLVLALVLALTLLGGTAAQAGPITYAVTYTLTPCPDGVVCSPSFSFSFELPDYVTTTGMFPLPVPLSFTAGALPETQTFTHAGTSSLGWWLFGDANDGITDGSYWFVAPLPYMVLGPPDSSGYITAPTTVAFSAVGGALFPSSAGYLSGTGSLTVTDSAAVPEPASLLLLGTGLLGLRAWRKRRQ